MLSEHSTNSEWVQTELRKAHHAERALGAGLPTPPLGVTEGLPESLETCGRRSAGSGDPRTAQNPRTARQKLFPIRLVSIDRIRAWSGFDADTGKDLAVELREDHITDFLNWKNHDPFKSAFADLLRDLRAQN